MRSLKLQMQITVDGFVAGPNGENDWVFSSGKGNPNALKEMVEFSAELAAGCDTVLIGGKTAKSGFVDYWQNVADNQPENPWHPFAQHMANHRKIVFSRTETAVPGRNVEMQNGDLVTAVQALKNEPGKDIVVYGGAGFVSALVSQNLIDEYYLIVNPVALGSGLSIFHERKVLQLESSTAFVHGKIVVKYVPVNG